jgi:predicted alpha/beta hydrolase family esterase
MTHAGRPKYQAWKAKIAREPSRLEGEIILVGHSLGASVLLKVLSEEIFAGCVTSVYLIAPPYWGMENWEVDQYKLQGDFAAKLPEDLPIVFYHSRDDDIVPFSHLELYREKLPQATFNTLDGRGHYFNNDLSMVAQDIQNHL